VVIKRLSAGRLLVGIIFSNILYEVVAK
jgi:hypothetical protein